MNESKKRFEVDKKRQIIPLLISISLGILGSLVIFFSIVVTGFSNLQVQLKLPNITHGTSIKTNSQKSLTRSNNGVCNYNQVLSTDSQCVDLPIGAKKLLFDDEFNANSINSSLWTVLNIHGDRNNNESECYIPANVTESNGVLSELLSYQSVVCPIDTADGGSSGVIKSNYASGSIEMNNHNFEYGIIQARIKFAGGTGSWPALWMLGDVCQIPNYLTANGCNWPHEGSEEIDIAELTQEAFINEQIHSDTGSPGCHANPSDPSSAWHIYSLAWGPKKLVFQIDGKTSCILTTSIPQEKMFIIINTAVGGIGGGQIDNSMLPQTTKIDYIRVFQ